MKALAEGVHTAKACGVILPGVLIEKTLRNADRELSFARHGHWSAWSKSAAGSITMECRLRTIQASAECEYHLSNGHGCPT